MSNLCIVIPHHDMAAEIVAIAIKNEQDIDGVTISQIEHKIKMLADTTFILPNIKSLINLLYLTIFTKVSGLKLNMQKTEVIPLGKKATEMTFQGYKN